MNALEKAYLIAPSTAGVYLMKDKADNVIYIGKAKHLKKRISSYLKEGEKRYQISFLVNKVASVEFISTSNEKEALILEDSLIKKFKPKYNIQLKDDKSYLCLMLNKNHDFPKFELIRRPIKTKNVVLWGPYPSAKVIKNIIETIQKLFPLRRCSDKAFLKAKKPCFYYYLEQCKAPCAGLISQCNYSKLIEGATALINGKNKSALPMLKNLMWVAAQRGEFEKAAFYRDIINNKIGLFETLGVVSYNFTNADIIGTFEIEEKTNICILFMRHGQIMHKQEFTVPYSLTLEDTLSQFITGYYRENVIPPDTIIIEIKLSDNKELEELLERRFNKKIRIITAKKEDELRLVKTASLNAANYKKGGAETLEKIKELFGLERPPHRIECFDVAHMMGMKPISAMTVMVDGELSKSDYRLFNFNESSFDDYQMLYKALKRRFSHMEWQYPDILLIDGGRGQLSVAAKVLSELQIKGVFPVAIAKDESTSLFIVGRKNPITINKGDDVFKLLSLLREEAHRFANYQLKKRLKVKREGGWKN